MRTFSCDIRCARSEFVQRKFRVPRNFYFILSIIFLFCTTTPTVFAEQSNYFIVTKTKKPNLTVQKQKEKNTLQGLPLPVLKYAINAYEWAMKKHLVNNPDMLTIVDFDKPSYERRLWLIDLRNHHVIMHIHVAQGRNSGKVYATRFSNAVNSHESSLGIFTTVGGKFYGEFGKSLHLRGWEQGINNNAYNRGILVHSEWYVTPHYVRHMGRVGRTWGCFAVNPDHIDNIIEEIQQGSVMFVYALPEKNDPLVNHDLSYSGKTLYEKILGINSNPITRFFERI